jgi:hypothetical protein
MTITTTEPPVLPAPTLAPTGDSEPVLQALVRSITAGHPPETWLWMKVPEPCVSVRHAWTGGGTELGDRIDLQAVAAGLDSADWLHITSQHAQSSARGRIEIHAHPLRPILADVQSGVRCPEGLRAYLHRVLDASGQTRRPGMPRWDGVGPTLLARRTP